MAKLEKKFSIESGAEGFVVSKGVDNQIQVTDDELLNSLAELPDSFLAKLQDKKLAQKKEQYEQLKPAGFKSAPRKAKKYRQELEDADDVDQMKHLSTILAYNQENTVGLPTIKETFCADLAGGRSMNRKDSMELAEFKGYHLLSDWNDCDSEVTKQSTDWYKLENLFGEYADKGALFCMLGFNNNRYWTSTTYENQEGVARDRGLYKGDCGRYGGDTNGDDRVCGFKHSM